MIRSAQKGGGIVKHIAPHSFYKDAKTFGGAIHPDFTSIDHAKLHESAEHLTTMDGSIKTVIVYRNYLLWYKSSTDGYINDVADADSGIIKDPTLSQHHSAEDSRNLKLHGFVDLAGCFVKPNPTRRSIGFNGSTGDSFHHSYFFQFCTSPAGAVAEVLFFPSRELQERWRILLSSCPVCFSDFGERYELVADLGRQGQIHRFKVKNTHSSVIQMVRLWKTKGLMTSADFEAVIPKIVREASILSAIKSKSISPEFHELISTSDCVGIVEENIDAIPFADWFREVWYVGLKNSKETIPVLTVFLELANLILQLQSTGISHGNFCRTNLFVKLSAIEEPLLPHFENQHKPIIVTRPNKAHNLGVPSQIPSRHSRFSTNVQQQQLSRASNQQRPVSSISNTDLGQCLQLKDKIYLVGFSQATVGTDSEESSALHSEKLSGLSQNESRPVGKQAPSGQAVGSSDVHALGKIFVEILYGIDIEHALQQQYGIETDFVSKMLQNPSAVLPGREPLYNIDSRVVDMLIMMLSPHQAARPDIQTITSLLQELMTHTKKIPSQQVTPLVPTNNKLGTLSRISIDGLETSFEGVARSRGSIIDQKQNTLNMVPSILGRSVSSKLKLSRVNLISRDSRNLNTISRLSESALIAPKQPTLDLRFQGLGQSKTARRDTTIPIEEPESPSKSMRKSGIKTPDRRPGGMLARLSRQGSRSFMNGGAIPKAYDWQQRSIDLKVMTAGRAQFNPLNQLKKVLINDHEIGLSDSVKHFSIQEVESPDPNRKSQALFAAVDQKVRGAQGTGKGGTAAIAAGRVNHRPSNLSLQKILQLQKQTKPSTIAKQ
jgi:hypothetical protein